MDARSIEVSSIPLLEDSPDAAFLQWLVRGGALRQNLGRAIRLWVWLRSLYGDETERLCLIEPFSYKDWRDAFFVESHPKGESIPDRHDPTCACTKTVSEWLFTPQTDISESDWRSSIQQQSAIENERLDEILESRLFAVTRRSLASDLKTLCELGWLRSTKEGYCRVTTFPDRPSHRFLDLTEDTLGGYDLGFLNPHLEAIAQQLSQPIAEEQRFFLEVDYIIPQTQQRVETWLERLKSIWAEAIVPPVRLEYNSARYGVVQCVVYPVCVYYVQRAIYLCALGKTPGGEDWYNYRLDKIQKMTCCDWADTKLPAVLKKRRGTLPTPYYIRQQMEQAWGFDFYLKQELMLLRFQREFHDRYIEGTFRHRTFQRISYDQAKQMIHDRAADLESSLMQTINARSPQDAYYQVVYRDGDTNVGLRLRSWRPKVEVFLPWNLRQKMLKEIETEQQFYQS